MISRAHDSSSTDNTSVNNNTHRLDLLERNFGTEEMKLGLAPISPYGVTMSAPEFLATPTGISFSNRMDFQSPMPPNARLASPSVFSSGSGKKSISSPPLSMPITCNFEALSHHFHLPLKVAAEKFGVRATAFKKRCRAIGIRHWPYRKVRSLKRSLQELGRCKDQGLLNDKQHHQLLVFQGQLDKLLSPETYGIDPSGRLPPGAFDDVDENDRESIGEDADDDDTSCSSNQSPHVEGATHFSDLKVSSLRTKRSKKHSLGARAASSKRDFALPSGTVSNVQHPHPYYMSLNDTSDTHQNRVMTSNTTGDLPSVSVRFATHPGQVHTHGLGGFESYDPFFQDFKSEFTLSMEDFGGHDDSHAAVYPMDVTAQDDFFSFTRSPTMAAIRSNNVSRTTVPLSSPPRELTRAPSRSPADPSENGDDDVFFHISPDYGCLV